MVHDEDQMYCGAIKRGDIFLTNKQNKISYIVLQDSVLNERLSTVIVAPIEEYRSGQKVFKNEVLFSNVESGLGKKGICMLHKTQLMDRRELVAKKGEVSLNKMQEIYHALDVNLGRFRDKKI